MALLEEVDHVLEVVLELILKVLVEVETREGWNVGELTGRSKTFDRVTKGERVRIGVVVGDLLVGHGGCLWDLSALGLVDF